MPDQKTTAAAGRRIRGLDAGERRGQRRRQLLDAALELFAAQGYAATSIEQICSAAYVGTKGFYEIFTNREDCYLALLRDISERVERQLTDLLATMQGDPAAAEHAIVAAFAHALVDDPRVALVTFGWGRAISPDVERQRRVNRRWAAGFAETVWARSGDDAVRPIATGLIGGLFDLIADWLLDSDPYDSAAVEGLIADLLAYYDVVRAGLLAGS